jgi:acyl dehydratase
MDHDHVKSYRRTPATLPLMARAAVSGIPGLSHATGIRRDGRGLANVVVRRRDQSIDLSHLTAYSRLCGFGLQATVPVTYPHVLAFGLQLALLTDRHFPFPALGLVHVNNSITQLRPVQTSERLDLEVRAANVRPHPRGRQVDVITTASVEGSVVWTELTTLLKRGGGHPSGQRDKPVPLPAGPVEWRLPADLGRRYATVSGDCNPIHLYALTARPFGFDRPIAHGMWSLARCLAGLAGRLPARYTVEATFIKPIRLPADVAYATAIRGAVLRFALTDAREGTPHLSGTITPSAVAG